MKLECVNPSCDAANSGPASLFEVVVPVLVDADGCEVSESVTDGDIRSAVNSGQVRCAKCNWDAEVDECLK